MKKPANALKPIVTDVLRSEAQEVIQQFRTKTSHPFLLDAKLGDATTGPMPDTAIASSYHTPLGSIGYRLTHVTNALAHADQQLGKPLHEIAQRTNDVMAEAAIINRHNRRPPLYAESTIGVLIKLGFATPQHSPLIRAAGYITPPPVVPRSHDIDDITADIAAHMAQSHEPQSPNDILQSLSHRQDDLSNWPQLDLTLFIDRVAGIRPDGVVLPKVSDEDDVTPVDEKLGEATPLFLMIETAAGVLNAASLARCSPRVAGLVFGAADYRESMRMQPDAEEREIFFARSQVVHAARAAGTDVFAFDTPTFEYLDDEALDRSARRARLLGFDGKTAVHPAQVATINEIFSPTPSEVARATKVAAAMEKAMKQGSSVTSLDGELIEELHLKGAKRTLDQAKALGLLPEA